MKINMAHIGNQKTSNNGKTVDNVNLKKQEEFDGILHNKKNSQVDKNAKQKLNSKISDNKNIMSSSVNKKIEEFHSKEFNESDNFTIIESSDEEFDIQGLMSALFCPNNTQQRNVYDLNKSNFDYLKSENSNLLNAITEILNKSDDKNISFSQLIFNKDFDISKLENLTDKKDIEDFLGNFVEKWNFKDGNKVEDISSLLDENIEAKNMIIKILKSKGFNDEDIKELSISIDLAKGKNNIENEFADEILIDNAKVISVQKQVNSEENQFSSNSFLSDKNESKEDKVLTEIIEQDELSIFDTHIQRVKDFSKVVEKDENTISKLNMKNDIKTTILHMGKTNMKELVVRVNPDNLGEIAIKIISDGDNMKAMLKVSSKETYALLNNQDIKSFLINQDIKVSDVEVSLYEDTTFFNEFDGFKDDGNNEKNKYQDGMHTEFIEFESDRTEEITLSSLDIII
ncbi:MAG: flagellar hook-length control protein FliK [Sarcina sp.]